MTSEPGMQIHVIGLGVSQVAQLDRAAEQALRSAGVVIGSERQLAVVSMLLTAEQQALAFPGLGEFEALLAGLARQGVISVAVLASGDPLFYGIGRWFGRHFDGRQLRFYPAISSVQAACHRLGLSLQDVTVVSLHGRPVEKIRTQLRRNRDLVILTDRHSTPQVLARECIAAGFADSHLTVCECLGYEQERITEFRAPDLVASETVFDSLNVTVARIRGVGGVLPTFPGIADEQFVTDGPAGKGMLTKREVRLAILSLMQPGDEEVVWDIGAGCGGVAVELAYWNERTRVFAIEHHPERLRCLEANLRRFGVVSNLIVVAGRAPQALEALPRPDRVFIGGSDGELPGLLERVWGLLAEGGVLVASAVTETTRQQLLGFLQQRQASADGQWQTLQVAVSKGGRLAGQLLYRPGLPVTLFKFLKVSAQSVVEDAGEMN